MLCRDTSSDVVAFGHLEPHFAVAQSKPGRRKIGQGDDDRSSQLGKSLYETSRRAMAFHPATAIAAPGHALGLPSGAWPLQHDLIPINGCQEMAAWDEIADRGGCVSRKEARSEPAT